MLSYMMEGASKASRNFGLLNSFLLWFNPCPSIRVFFENATTGDEDGSQGVKNTLVEDEFQ